MLITEWLDKLFRAYPGIKIYSNQQTVNGILFYDTKEKISFEYLEL